MTTTCQEIFPRYRSIAVSSFHKSCCRLTSHVFFSFPSVNFLQSLLCHLLSSSKWESNEAETSTFISALGYTSADYYCHLVENVSVLCNWDFVYNKSPVYKHIHGVVIVIRNMNWTLFIFSYLSYFYSLLREKMRWEIFGQKRIFWLKHRSCNRGWQFFVCLCNKNACPIIQVSLWRLSYIYYFVCKNMTF